MPIFRWGSALDAFHDLEREMDRWVRRVDLAVEGLRLGRPFPAINLYEIDEAFLLTAELPGSESKDIDVSVANGVLKLQGTRMVLGNVPEDRFRRSERPSGIWERTIGLPERVDETGIRAELVDGLLKLTLPKLPSTQARQIQVLDGSVPKLTVKELEQ